MDLIAPRIAFSASGTAAIASGVENIDNAAASEGSVTVRSHNGRLSGPLRVPGAQEVLDLAYDGPDLELLFGGSPQREPCCSFANAIRFSAAGGFGASQRLVSGLAGATAGRLLGLRGSIAAAVASERGVWVSRSSGAGQFGAVRALDSRALPQTLEATSLADAQTFVAWTTTAGEYAPGPRRILVAAGSSTRAPHGRRVAITVAPGHRIDELALAPGVRTPTLAWIESWYDSGGGFHSSAVVADLARSPRARPVSSDTAPASAIALAGNARGDQVVAWKACTQAGACGAYAALRPARGKFAASQSLGSIDAGQAPEVTLAPVGRALIGRIDHGVVKVADARAGSASFGAASTVSHSSAAADLTLSYGPAGEAIAAWIQGSRANQSVFGAAFRSR